MKHEVKDDPVAELMRLVRGYGDCRARLDGNAAWRLCDEVETYARKLAAARKPLTWPPIVDPKKLTLDPVVETIGTEEGSGWSRVHVRADGVLVQEHIPAAAVLAERPCFCNGVISLQSVAGGAHPTGLYGTVWMRIGGQVVEYTRKASGPAVVSRGAKP